jgi:hypothetical protein
MPLGKYKTFGECVGAQKRDGKNDLSARKICGQIEKNTQEGLKKEAGSNVKYEDDNGHLYIKAFLLSSEVNINQWGVSPSSLEDKINTFIGKPLVLTENFKHPMPPDMDRVAGNEEYDDDDDPYNAINVDEIVDHWLQYQEVYRVGSIIDITEKKGTYYAIIEITDPAAKDAFRNNEVPLFVSPAIAQLDPMEDPSNITNWTGIHLAIVSNPAYTIKKALISGQCHGETERCVLQLRQASVQQQQSNNEEIPRLSCGFCRTGALARYAEIVKSWRTKHSVVINAKNPKDFANSSIEFSNTNSKLEELTDQTNNQTNDTNKEQEFEKKQEQQGGDLGEQNQKGNPKESIKTTKDTEESTEVTKEAAQEIAIKVAGMPECIQIFQQNGVQDPQQAEQICKLAAQALMENQNQQQPPNSSGSGFGGKTQGAPRGTGQFGSVTEYEKELAKQEARIAELTDQLKTYKKGDKTDAQRIAELEDQVATVTQKFKEKELEAYLVTKIADEELRNKKIKRFAELNLSIDDVKDIYPPTTTKETPPGNTGNIKKTAEVESSPISKVKLQVASTNDNNKSAEENSSNPVRERNNKIISSLLSKGGIY